MSIPPPTERLTFREWSPGDLDEFHAVCADARVMQFVGDGRPWTRTTTEQFIQRAMAISESAGFCRWPVIHRGDSAVIGFCGFVNSVDGPEIGWRLAADYWGRGLATEAARAVLNHGFETLGFQRVVATVQAPNRASIRVAEKLEMEFDRSFQRSGREILVYAVKNPGQRGC
jgi:RimJ/RimL family protein N-acetyltransferase